MRSFDLHGISCVAACGVEGHPAGTTSSPAVEFNPRGLNVYQSDAHQPDARQPDTCQPDTVPPNVS